MQSCGGTGRRAKGDINLGFERNGNDTAHNNRGQNGAPLNRHRPPWGNNDCQGGIYRAPRDFRSRVCRHAARPLSTNKREGRVC